jgi:arylsulfatase
MNNIRQAPSERTRITNALAGAPTFMNDLMAGEFWRFVFVQDKVATLARTAIAFPPMQQPASLNLQAVKEYIEEASAAGRRGQ